MYCTYTAVNYHNNSLPDRRSHTPYKSTKHVKPLPHLRNHTHNAPTKKLRTFLHLTPVIRQAF
jgi:hypothetical protein